MVFSFQKGPVHVNVWVYLSSWGPGSPVSPSKKKWPESRRRLGLSLLYWSRRRSFKSDQILPVEWMPTSKTIFGKIHLGLSCLDWSSRWVVPRRIFNEKTKKKKNEKTLFYFFLKLRLTKQNVYRLCCYIISTITCHMLKKIIKKAAFTT